MSRQLASFCHAFFIIAFETQRPLSSYDSLIRYASRSGAPHAFAVSLRRIASAEPPHSIAVCLLESLPTLSSTTFTTTQTLPLAACSTVLVVLLGAALVQSSSYMDRRPSLIRKLWGKVRIRICHPARRRCPVYPDLQRRSGAVPISLRSKSVPRILPFLFPKERGMSLQLYSLPGRTTFLATLTEIPRTFLQTASTSLLLYPQVTASPPFCDIYIVRPTAYNSSLFVAALSRISSAAIAPPQSSTRPASVLRAGNLRVGTSMACVSFLARSAPSTLPEEMGRCDADAGTGKPLGTTIDGQTAVQISFVSNAGTAQFSSRN
ncbi:hypothetical protein MSAN_00873600 [Mycena sanguinolenta]|uniref:Uncharacterized protein n=1 Tax=Mycena sanguinolenta TaxID=230812 RepID=A0A8H6Z2E9_9AGAR|nr:hypothetical protein MSAN_00873600 [Mycena sanguinolenta]